ncbi:MAG: PASTA domain-containing protein [Thermodesulfobacteriota bacterium]
MIRTLSKYLVLLAVFCGIAGFSAFFTMSWLVKSEDTVVVPQLEKKDAIDALELLSDLGLNTKVKGSEYHGSVAKNHVIHQDPDPGATIKKGREVSLVISKGARQVTMPEVTGQSLAQAKILLEENGLQIGHRSHAFTDRVTRDNIIAQYPKPGKMVKRNRGVDLLVSEGKRPVAFQMPDLKGRFLDEAVVVIENHSLVLDGVSTVYDQSKPVNAVIGQAPPRGYHVKQDRGVRLTINRKPGGDKKADTGRLFQYRVPPGFLKQHVRLQFNAYGMSVPVYDRLMKPGSRIWTIVPKHTEAALFLYVNDELVKSNIYD